MSTHAGARISPRAGRHAESGQIIVWATFLLPIADHGSEIANLAGPVLQDIFDGKAKAADVLPNLNDQINALFK